MGLFGAKNRRTRELANEVLKPLGVSLDGLKDTSKQNFEKDIRRVVDMGKDDVLYDRQKGWEKP